MKKETLKYLGCCRCKSDLKIESERVWREEIREGRLVCANCGLSFPIAVGRPVVMTSGAVSEWKSPVSEAMGQTSYATFEDSIAKLLSVGIDEALKIVTRKESFSSDSFDSLPEIHSSVTAKMKYRASGEWFRYGRRMERLMTFPWKNGDTENSFNVFMKKIADTNPEFLLDVASGGGFGVSHQVWLNSAVRQTLAIERDLKCLGNIQYRFKHLGRADNSEAVGGDVRHLPVRPETVDTVMMLMALPEIHGITSVISEVYKALKDGGCWIILVSELPFASELVSQTDFVRFAEGADLYSGYEKFQADSEKCGFRIESSRRFKEKSGKLMRLISLSR